MVLGETGYGAIIFQKISKGEEINVKFLTYEETLLILMVRRI